MQNIYSSGANALHWREEGTGRHTGINTWARNRREIDVDNGGKVVCGQQFRHNRYKETSRRGAEAQKDEEINNNGSP